MRERDVEGWQREGGQEGDISSEERVRAKAIERANYKQGGMAGQQRTRDVGSKTGRHPGISRVATERRIDHQGGVSECGQREQTTAG